MISWNLMSQGFWPLSMKKDSLQPSGEMCDKPMHYIDLVDSTSHLVFLTNQTVVKVEGKVRMVCSPLVDLDVSPCIPHQTAVKVEVKIRIISWKLMSQSFKPLSMKNDSFSPTLVNLTLSHLCVPHQSNCCQVEGKVRIVCILLVDCDISPCILHQSNCCQGRSKDQNGFMEAHVTRTLYSPLVRCLIKPMHDIDLED
ncbi:uncharacterized protein O3C94_011781 [Discoglossus pictus]